MLRESVFLLFLAAISWARPDANLASRNTEQPILTTPLGQVQGSIIASRLGKQIFSFRAIRYAKAPVNELRFKPPVAVEKWEGIFNATQDGPLCPQDPKVVDPTSEDCLLLNVYSTKVPKNGEKSTLKYPVIVYIHGTATDAKTVGGASYWLGPQYLLDQDIVLVTFNYRVGSLGFLQTGDKEATGNMGLKDQVAVLKWVKQNIESFGGDPNSVTLMGSDFGAVSVTLHMVSPMSQGLFHRAIAMSGSALGSWALPNSQVDLSKKQAKLLNCPEDTPANIIKCMRGKTYDEISDTYPHFKEFGMEPIYPWMPVVEEDLGQEKFLPSHPITLIQNNQFMKIPFLTGITTEEHAKRAFNILNNDDLRNKLNTKFDELLPVILMMNQTNENTKVASKELKKFYFNDKTIEKTAVAPMVQMLSDGITGFSVNRAAKLISEKNPESVYYYRFNYGGRYSNFYTPQSNNTEPFGAVHNDDLMYLFFIEKSFPLFKDTMPNDAEMVTKMTTLWVNFAKSGKPIPEPNEKLDNVKWECYNQKTQKYMDIGNKLVLNEKLYDKRYPEWEKLFPLSVYTKLKSG